MNWQPIETAPKDGNAVLAWCRIENGGPGEFASVVFWNASTEGWRIPGYVYNSSVPVVPRLWAEIETPDIINGLPQAP